MNIRINSRYHTKSKPSYRTEIYKYYKYYFDYFLTPEPDLDFEIFKKIYVPNTEAEDLLTDFLSFSSCIQLLIGYTGIGKTTIIRNFFGLINENPVIRENEGFVIVPIFPDSDIVLPPPEIFFGSQLSSLNHLIESKYKLKVHDSEIWDQVNFDKSRILEEARMGDFISKEDDISKLKEKKYFAYHAEKFKALTLKVDSIKSIIFILDDLESIMNNDDLNDYLMYVTKAFKCLRNFSKKLSVKVLISERPHTIVEFDRFDWIDNKKESDIILSKIPHLKDIFLKRNEVALEYAQNNIKERKSYDEALDIICQLLHNVEENGGDSITFLNNFNIRKSMRILERSLASSQEYEKKDRNLFYSTGSLKNIKFNPSHSALLRAISYLGNQVYKESTTLPLRNPFNCAMNEKDWPLIFYIISWFFYKANDTDPCNVNDSYAIIDLKKDFGLIFPLISNMFDLIDFVIKELYDRKFLEKNPFTNEQYLISPRGIFIFRELSESNVLFEIYRDDIPLNQNFILKASSELRYNDRFLECYKIIHNFCSLDEPYVSSITERSQKEQFNNLFNSTIISRHFLNGMLSSTEKVYGKTIPEIITSKIQEINVKVNKLEEFIR